METAARAARVGNAVLSLMAFIIIIVMFAYGGYSLWDSYMVNQGAFLSSDLLKYKPQTTEDGGANYTLEELMAINEDTRGWITIDDTHIDYPFVQGETDMEYINMDIMGEFALSGAIFQSCMNSPDFSDTYNLLYGHHMDNAAIFSDVMEFLDAGSYREKLEILQGMRDKISDRVLDDIGMSLDLAVDDKPTEEKYLVIRNYLKTQIRFEDRRLR